MFYIHFFLTCLVRRLPRGFRAKPADDQRSRTIRVVGLSSSSTTSARRRKSLKDLSAKDF
jgi:hypothetical protein